MAGTSLDKSRIKFLLLEGIHPSAVELLKNNGYSNVVCHSKALSGDELKAEIADAHFIGIRSRTNLTDDVFADAKKLAAVGCFCIGTNQVDLNAALIRGIPVFNAPYSNTRSVAELVLAEAILLLRGIPEKNAKAHRGVWQKSANGSYETRGKTLGIIGYGSIGSQLSVLAESLGMRVIFYDAVTKLPLGNAAQVSTLSELLNKANVVSLHVPDLPETRNMIRKEHFDQMQDGAIIINAARGKVIDIPALDAALASGKLAGAAIDVFPVEPKSNDDPFESPLKAHDNVILTPHIGGSTMEAQANIGVEVADKLIRYSDNGSTLSSVNFPEVALPPHAGYHRILHIHKNQPGVLAAINTAFSDKGINIGGQYLQTNDNIGYVVLDIDQKQSDAALKELSAIDGTLKVRVLF